MTPDEAVRAAMEAIGKSKSTDYRLAPLDHASELPDAAQPLGNLLTTDTRLAGIAEQYSDRDNEATKAQNQYKSTLSFANRATLAATILGAIMMAAQILASGATDQQTAILKEIAMAAGILAGLAGAAGAASLFKARQGELLETWLRYRAKAEAHRKRYFDTLLASDDDPTLGLLKLEYFRRYQVEVQCNYFKASRERHATAAAWTLQLGAWAVGLSSLSGFAAGFSGGSWTALGAVSVIGAALGAYAGAREAMSQDRRNTERYENALEALQSLSAGLGDVRLKIANGNKDVLKTFVSAVNDQLANEHRQWLEAALGAKKAADAIGDALANVGKSPPQKS